jgi:hypothetical protein
MHTRGRRDRAAGLTRKTAALLDLFRYPYAWASCAYRFEQKWMPSALERGFLHPSQMEGAVNTSFPEEI